MKKILLLVLAILLFGKLEAQIPDDTIFYALSKIESPLAKGSAQLQSYEVSACLHALLDNLVNNDIKCASNIGYYFSIMSNGIVSVSPVDLNRVRSDNFYGYFIFRERVFICYGYNSNFLLKKSTEALLTLKPYVSSLKLDDLYLGGDTDGRLKDFYCNGEKKYALIKTCKRYSETRINKGGQ